MNILLKYYVYENKNKPYILLLHGFMGISSDWEGVVEKLKDDYSLILIDLPGHGDSINLPDECFTFTNITDQIKSLIKLLNITQINIIAYSMGGRLILDLILNSDININKIIFESVSFGIKNEKQIKERLISEENVCYDILNNYEEFIYSWYSMPMWGNFAQSTKYKALVNKRLLNNKEELCKSLKYLGQGQQISYWDKVHKIDKMLYITGEYDTKYNLIAANIIKLNSNIKHIIVENTGHNIHYEKQKEYLNIINNYLIE